VCLHPPNEHVMVFCSPAGREFVAGSYDRTVRIFNHSGGHSREVYHTKRMQRVFAVRFSGDGSYVFSGEQGGWLLWAGGGWDGCIYRWGYPRMVFFGGATQGEDGGTGGLCL
jgi:WD40 repeat protein